MYYVDKSPSETAQTNSSSESDSLIKTTGEVQKIAEMPQRNIVAVNSDQSEPYEIIFRNNNKQYTTMFYFERINDHSDPEIVPEIELYFSLSNDSSDDFYYIGKYIAGMPMMAPAYRYGVEQEAFTSILIAIGMTACTKDNGSVDETSSDIENLYADTLQNLGEQWARAFCRRDGDTLYSLCNDKNLFFDIGGDIVEEDGHKRIGRSSPWPWNEDEVKIIVNDGCSN